MTEGARQTLELIDACLRGEEIEEAVLVTLGERSDLSKRLGVFVHELFHFVYAKERREREPEHRQYWRELLIEMRDEIIRGV